LLANRHLHRDAKHIDAALARMLLAGVAEPLSWRIAKPPWPSWSMPSGRWINGSRVTMMRYSPS